MPARTPPRRTSASCAPPWTRRPRSLGRYIRLTNYASGLCMPEIATLAGLERLDMMLNDSMYGILFRDINPVRTFVDQRFSRQIHARADHHQHRRGQLPHHRRRGRGRPHGHRQPAAQRVLRQGGGPGGLAARARPRVRDQPRPARQLPDGARPRPARAPAVPRRAAEVDAPDQAHDGRRLPRLPARRVLQPRRRHDRPGDPARGDDDRGRGDAVPPTGTSPSRTSATS